MDIKSLINKVIASKGILRVPSWWMKKLLNEIIGYIDSGDSANANSIVKVKKEADSKITTLESNTDSRISTLEDSTNNRITTLETSTNNKITTLKDSTNNKITTLETSTNNVLFELIETANLPISIKCFTVKTESNRGFVFVDGVKQSIPANSARVITFVTDFCFGRVGHDYNYITFIGLTATDTSAITTMDSMFYNLKSLTSLDLSSFDTSAVTDMNGMFCVCSALTSLDLSSFDTSAVTDMNRMFCVCSALTSLDLSSFDTSAVTDMNRMFLRCTSLTSLDLSSFDTSAVTDMNRMFLRCTSLTSLDLSSFDTSAVTDMEAMFDSCTSIVSLHLGPNFFKTSAVTSIGFSDCSKWTNDTVVTSLVTNSYDRASAGLNTLTLQLHANTKAALSDEQKAAITSKGYTIA